jgi:hypothetical protein
MVKCEVCIVALTVRRACYIVIFAPNEKDHEQKMASAKECDVTNIYDEVT